VNSTPTAFTRDVLVDHMLREPVSLGERLPVDLERRALGLTPARSGQLEQVLCARIGRVSCGDIDQDVVIDQAAHADQLERIAPARVQAPERRGGLACER
jgi:hypothetical protein